MELLTWRDLDDDLLRKLHTDDETGCWTVCDRLRTEDGRIVIDDTFQDHYADEQMSYADTALNLARWHREAILVKQYPDKTLLALANREVDVCRQNRIEVPV